MWERFSYYGMRALLILFMTAPVATGGLGFDTAKAGPIYALYVSSVYLLSLPGGWVADRVLGLRPTVFVGGVIIMAGHICLAMPALTTFYLGLVLIAVGTGLLKPNVSVLVGKLYAPDDVRRDAGYSLYYMGINTGAFIAPLVCRLAGTEHRLPGRARLDGLLTRELLALGIRRGRGGHVLRSGAVPHGRQASAGGRPPSRTAERPGGSRPRGAPGSTGGLGTVAVIVLGALLVATGAVTLDPEAISRSFKWVLIGVTVGFFAWLLLAPGGPGRAQATGGRRRAVRGRDGVLGGLRAGRLDPQPVRRANTANVIFGKPFPASWYQSLPPLFVIIFAPVFAGIWLRLGARNPSSPVKFTIALRSSAWGSRS